MGEEVVLGRDLNDIKGATEKQGGRVRSEDSFRHFRDIITVMEMGKLQSKGRV